MIKTLGIHHITAIASNPKQCVDFYTKVLGLRLVKKSVNQDQVEAYHLFFGDRTGEPGMDLTFFTFPGIGQGHRGLGTVSKISLAVPADSLDWWVKRFEKFNVKHEPIKERFGQKCLTFYDNDNQCLELVGILPVILDHALPGNVWITDEVDQTKAIRCFHSATLAVSQLDLIEPTISNVLGFEKQTVDKNLSLYQNLNSSRGAFLEVEVLDNQNPVYPASGTVHHIAFQVEDEKHLLEMRQEVLSSGLNATEVIDRYYFKSVYFRTRAGILFELATNGPGFTVDEDEATLGQKLALPPFLENQREEIEKGLEPLEQKVVRSE